MPLLDTLEALNGLASPGANTTIASLWRRLALEFVAEHDPVNETNLTNNTKAPTIEFRDWALSHVHPKVLAWATDDCLIDGDASLPGDTLRRWKYSLRHLNTSLGVIAFLFGTRVVASRTCCDAFCDLCRATPTLSLPDFFARFVDQGEQNKKKARPWTPEFLFKKVMQSCTYATPLHVERIPPAVSATNLLLINPVSSEDPGLSKHARTRKPVQSSSTKGPRRPHKRISESPERVRGEDQQEANGDDAQPNMGEASSDADISHERRLSSPLPSAPDVSAIEESDREAVLGDRDGPLEYNNESFHFTDQDLDEDDAVEHNFDGSETPANPSDSLPMPLHSSTTNQTQMLSTQQPPKLPTITEEEPTSPYDMGSNILVTRGSFSKRKRSLSMTEILEASDNNDGFAPLPKVARQQYTMLQSPGLTHSTHAVPRMGITVEEIMNSMRRLEPGCFLNDFIVNTMAHRLASEEVGIIDSLTIASKVRTPNFRAKIQSTMSRNRVLIFVNHERHWLLYVWTGADRRLREYNSMPAPGGEFAPCCATVTDFVKWAHSDPAMAINLERPACAEQPNGWDCRVYAIRFAQCLAAGQAVPDAIDGSLERKCLMNAMLVTWAATLHPAEILATQCPLTTTPADKLRQFRNYYRRKCSFHQLLCGPSSEYATSSVFTTGLRRMAESEDDAIQKSVLASMIDSIHVDHRKSLELALSATTKATTLLKASRPWATIKTQIDDLLMSIADMDAVGDLATLPAPDQSRRRNIEIIKNAGENIKDNWDLCQGSGRIVEEAREQARAHFVFARVQLLILHHAVRKFRQHDTANADNA